MTVSRCDDILKEMGEHNKEYRRIIYSYIGNVIGYEL